MFIITYDSLYIASREYVSSGTLLSVQTFKCSNVQMFSHTNIHLLGQFYI